MPRSNWTSIHTSGISLEVKSCVVVVVKGGIRPSFGVEVVLDTWFLWRRCKFRRDGQRVDEDADGGEEDVGGVERVVRGQRLVVRRLQNEGEGGVVGGGGGR